MGGSETILLVDAVEDERTVYAGTLVAAGFFVVQASTGSQALAESHVAPPDLIVADLALPQLTGLELLAFLKQDETTKRIPVIMLTGRDQPLAVVGEARAAGAAIVRVRPYDPGRLLQDAAGLLEASREQRLRATRLGVRARESDARATAAIAQSLHELRMRKLI